jgi:hypothetical protein
MGADMTRNTRFDGARSHLPLLAAASALLLLFPDRALAGGVAVDAGSLSFDDDPGKREFAPDTRIVMRFRYRDWAYAGKPNAFIVFELETLGEGSAKGAVDVFLAKINRGEGYGTATLSLPSAGKRFRIRHHYVPFFSHTPLGASAEGLVGSAQLKKRIAEFYRHNPAGTAPLAEVRSTAGEVPEETGIMTVYFKQGLRAVVDKEIEARRPPTFEWSKGSDSAPGVQGEEYSYRLDPLEDWSQYSSARRVTYYLLLPGNYSFQVRARYTIAGEQKETAVANLPISVKAVISAPPPSELVQQAEKASPDFWSTHTYPHRRALLVGISEYDDPSFGALPYVEKDVTLVARVLRDLGFAVEVIDSDTVRGRVEQSLLRALDTIAPGDAVVLYVSGHGTSEGLSSFIVTTDCDSRRKTKTCITYDALRAWGDRAVAEKRAQHVLIVLDACQAGLGLYSKSGAHTPLSALATYPGVHLMTAGLMEQSAHVDVGTGVSVFTQYLAKGLGGAADANDDKVISLSELLSYVQNNVSRHVSERFNESQVPVMGKLKGAGEMLFPVLPASASSPAGPKGAGTAKHGATGP